MPQRSRSSAAIGHAGTRKSGPESDERCVVDRGAAHLVGSATCFFLSFSSYRRRRRLGHSLLEARCHFCNFLPSASEAPAFPGDRPLSFDTAGPKLRRLALQAGAPIRRAAPIMHESICACGIGLSLGARVQESVHHRDGPGSAVLVDSHARHPCSRMSTANTHPSSVACPSACMPPASPHRRRRRRRSC